MKRKHFYSDLELDKMFLMEIPDIIEMYACHGSYDISDNKLISLKNSPYFVKGNFFCNGNQLTSLRDGPQEVQGNYKCNNNRLKSLDGIAKIIGAGLDVTYNELTSLQGIPTLKKFTTLRAGENKITTLVGCGFESIEFSSFDVTVNKLTSLAGSPVKIFTNYECCANPIENFIGGPRYIGRNFYGTFLPNLKSIDGLPEKIEDKLFMSKDDLNRIFPDLTHANLIQKIREKTLVLGSINLI